MEQGPDFHNSSLILFEIAFDSKDLSFFSIHLMSHHLVGPKLGALEKNSIDRQLGPLDRKSVV